MNVKYQAVQSLISDHKVTHITQVFEVVPISTVAKDLGMNYSTLYRKIRNTTAFTIGDIELMASLFGVKPVLLFTLLRSSLSLKHDRTGS